MKCGASRMSSLSCFSKVLREWDEFKTFENDYKQSVAT